MGNLSKFLKKNDDTGYGRGCGEGYGRGLGDGDGDGYCYGDDDGCGYGYGYGYDDGCGYGYGYGSGYGRGLGDGDGDGYLIGGMRLNGHQIYITDKIPTIYYSVHGNFAKGAIVRNDLSLKPCVVVRVDDCFAHGETFAEAFADAQRKSFQQKSVEERIEAFIKKYPTLNTIALNKDLFDWHNILTGSCRMGRTTFTEEHDLDVEHGEMMIREFIKLTADAYGGETIKKLKEAYERNIS